MTYIQNRRVHVGPRDFDHGAATDYWINFLDAANQTAAASATNPSGLSGWLMTTTSLVATAGTAGALNSSASQTPAHILTNASADLFRTPRMFGGYDQFQRVADVLGYAPTKLYVDFYAAFTVITADETTSAIGLFTGTDAAAAGSAGAVTIDTTSTPDQFQFTSDTQTSNGPTADTAWHKFRIAFGTTVEWFTDVAAPGTLASAGSGITLETGIWPQPFSFIAGTTNRPALSWAHIWYGL